MNLAYFAIGFRMGFFVGGIAVASILMLDSMNARTPGPVEIDEMSHYIDDIEYQ